MNPFEEHLKNTIRQNGPMSVSVFMAMAMEHYYATRDPFGLNGDFTTAPEISQMFGEMIGVFLADAWMKKGSPGRFNLVEAGPGRGTLMADILRATKSVPGFNDAAKINLIERSPVLREKQKKALSACHVTWHDDLETLQGDGSLYFVANEFLDALPIHQYVRHGGAWHERVIGFEDERLVFGLSPAPAAQSFPDAEEGAILEHAPVRENFVEDIARLLETWRGVAVFIDYGHDVSGFGDTLQAVRQHKFHNIFEDIGEADLTSHVDFGALKRAAEKHSITVEGPVGQGQFLKSLGIEMRAGRLNQHNEFHRLTGPDQMGDLFRVMVLRDGSER